MLRIRLINQRFPIFIDTWVEIKLKYEKHEFGEAIKSYIDYIKGNIMLKSRPYYAMQWCSIERPIFEGIKWSSIGTYVFKRKRVNVNRKKNTIDATEKGKELNEFEVDMIDFFNHFKTYKRKNVNTCITGIPWLWTLIDDEDNYWFKKECLKGFRKINKVLTRVGDTNFLHVTPNKLLYIVIYGNILLLEDSIINACLSVEWNIMGLEDKFY